MNLELSTFLKWHNQIQRKMQLVQIDSFEPQKQALFLHSSLPCLAVHPSGRLISYQTRSNELILTNTATGRTISLFSSLHPLTNIIFTHKYVIATHQTCREVLIFSLKTEKLKSKLTGHRADITDIAYCRQRQVIASISHDLCLIHSQATLTHIKSLKCSTSSFIEASFGQNGSVLATSFKDGTVMFWDIDEWTHRESHVIANSPKMALTNSIAAVYDSKKLWLGDITKETILYKQIDCFWEGNIKQLLFLNYILVMSTDQALYLIEIKNQNSFQIVQVRKVDTVSSFITHTDYQTTLVSLSKNFKKIRFLKMDELKNDISKIKGSPLTNEGLVCAGGYSKEDGCLLQQQTNYINTNTNNDYAKTELKVEPLIEGVYSQIPPAMSLPKLKEFLRKHYCLPDKYRPLAYRQALKLPVSAQNFKILQRKGHHPSVELLESNYPIENQYLNEKLKQIMSLLSHWSPVLAQSQIVPAIVFPFVCLIGQDVFMCFEILYRLFLGPLSFVFKDYPLANSEILQNMWQILKKEDPVLVAHFESKKISFVKLAWSLISTLFTSTLTREGFLAIADTILIRNDEPETILFLSLGYLIFNRKRLLSAENQSIAMKLCEEEQTIHLPKYFSTVNKLQQKYRKDIRYPLKTSENKGSYEELEFPLDSVKMHETRSKIWLEELHKQKEAEIHRQTMLVDFQKITTNARREAERQTLEQEAYRMHCDKQKNRKIELKQIDRKERILMIEKMMDELTASLDQQKVGRQLFRNYIPTIENIKATTSDEKLDELEMKLMKLLEQVRPGNNSLKLLASHPTNIVKNGNNSKGSALEGAMGARLAKRLWELDQQARKNQDMITENRVLATFK